MEERHLSEELLQEHAENILKLAGKIWKNFRRGFITEDEWSGKMSEVLAFRGVTEFLEKNDLKTDLEDDRFAAFERDRDAFRKGTWPGEGGRTPWLFTIRKKAAACPEDHRLAMLLMERLYLPAECFRPFIHGPVYPQNKESHSWHNCTARFLDFGCTDDGGLLTDPAPVGRTFTLVGEYGLKAVLTIIEDRRGGEREGLEFDELITPVKGGYCCINAEFLARGSIEGYTAETRTGTEDVLIRLEGERVKFLSYYEYPEDWKAHRNHPVWRQYYEDGQKFYEERKRIRKDAFLELCRTFPDPWQGEAAESF